ncbi:hypothetical protein [Candidatus Palauibacter sp.]|uniref:hypothetical protein n=1 Tax=Candidatus Palauibacter sp. TaxID=3101350 RepID=UPI003B527853
MDTYRKVTFTFFSLPAFIVLLAVASTSCDTLPVTPEMSSTAAVPGADADAGPYPAMTVGGGAANRFQIDVVTVNQGARDLTETILAQADRWARIVHRTDLEDIEWEPGTISCGSAQHDYQDTVLDDVLVMVSVQDYFTGPTKGAGVWICGFRESSKLPTIGAIFLDIEGLPDSQRDGLILHGLGHILGFGFSWEDLGLLRNSSWDNEGADTHFTGSRATAAFIAAGGANYPDGRVPVENYWSNGTVDYHWRKAVFGTELMSPRVARNSPHPISAITVQSLADIGYTVDVWQADAYILPAASAAAGATEDGPAIHINEEVVISPAVFYDRQGRVVRVVRD